jgi:hypothetical protein
MVAVAAGDAAEAGRQAKRADALLGDPPLTMLLSAQAAQLNGDDVKGDTAQAILARAEARVQADDLAGAVAELTKLTGAPAKSVASWRRDAESRLLADNAIAALTRVVIHQLAVPDAPTAPNGAPKGQ